ncbi:isochorismatase family protein [Fodinicola acaciae]|uniref:isochorismatase family protein n=1 Tax=Fodinicola acaciae TaxID=2681555 RepID=UPI0013D01CC2|nr:isochorismatase family protein [Fodinicola acaciae]
MTYRTDTALIVVDVQNDFADPKGGLYVADGEETVPVVNAEIAAAQAAQAPVFYTQDWHPPVTPHFAKDGGVWPVHCVAGTWGAELHPELTVDGPVVRKGVGGEDGYSGFSVRDPVSDDVTATELDSLLKARSVRHVVVTGLAGDVCVKATALDAKRLGYSVTVPVAATRFVNLQPGDDARAVEEMRAAGIDVVE